MLRVELFFIFLAATLGSSEVKVLIWNWAGNYLLCKRLDVSREREATLEISDIVFIYLFLFISFSPHFLRGWTLGWVSPRDTCSYKWKVNNRRNMDDPLLKEKHNHVQSKSPSRHGNVIRPSHWPAQQPQSQPPVKFTRGQSSPSLVDPGLTFPPVPLLSFLLPVLMQKDNEQTHNSCEIIENNIQIFLLSII